MREIEINGRTYIEGDPGYYGVRVEPGSDLDTTSGLTGIHWEYLPAAADSEIVRELREAAKGFRVPEPVQVDSDPVVASLAPICPKCSTVCYGDCRGK